MLKKFFGFDGTAASIPFLDFGAFDAVFKTADHDFHARLTKQEQTAFIAAVVM